MTRRPFATTRTWIVLTAIGLVPAIAGGARSNRSTESVQGPDRSTWDSVYTVEQATRGQAAYNQTCARCHKETLTGGDEAPALTGSSFMSGWNGQTLGELHERVRTTMPTDTPGVYGRQQTTDVIAHVLRVNGFPAGQVELTHENDALKGIRFVATKP